MMEMTTVTMMMLTTTAIDNVSDQCLLSRVQEVKDLDDFSVYHFQSRLSLLCGLLF